MSKNRVHTKKIKMPAYAADMSEMFNQMIGTGVANMSIAYPRYLRMFQTCKLLVNLLTQFAECPILNEYPTGRDEILNFCADAKGSMEKMFRINLLEYMENYAHVPPELGKEFTETYNDMKKSNLVNVFIVCCDQLVPYRRQLCAETPSAMFINDIPGNVWGPLPFSSLNFKDIIIKHGNRAPVIDFILAVLAKLYEKTYALYRDTQEPDIDIDEFARLISDSIDAIRNLPELHKCRRAFDKIKDCVHMLKSKFPAYYSDFVMTKDSTIIMQNFVIDVSKSGKTDARLSWEFRQIIQYYKKLAMNKSKDPKMDALFDNVCASLVRPNAQNLVNIDDSSEEESPAEEPAEPAAAEYSAERATNADKSIDELVDFINEKPRRRKK